MIATVLDIIFFTVFAFIIIISFLFLVAQKLTKENPYEMLKTTSPSSDFAAEDLEAAKDPEAAKDSISTAKESNVKELNAKDSSAKEPKQPDKVTKKKKLRKSPRLSPPLSIQRNLLRSHLTQQLISFCTLISVVVAICVGILIRLETDKWTQRHLMYLEFPGEIFLRMLRSLILPLVVSSLISALGNLEVKLSSSIGKRAVIYYLSTTVLSVLLGIGLVLIISPGTKIQDNWSTSGVKKQNTTTEDLLLDLIRNLFPPNIVEATFSQTVTHLEQPRKNETDVYKWIFKVSKVDGINFLGLVFFTIVTGIIIGKMQKAAKPILNFFVALNNATMKLTELLIRITPVGIFFLVMPKIVAVDDINKLLGGVGYFGMTVIIGSMIQGAFIFPGIYFLVTRKDPFYFIQEMTQALVTAFGTSSSLATLPVTVSCLEKAQVDKRVVRFCVPIGSIINMDGTALYEAVAAIFIAQSRGIEMDVAKVVIVLVTATAASIGAAGVPSGGLTTMLVMVLNAIGLPAEDIALVVVIDWILDRFRTVINVMGDCIGAAVVDHWSRNDLEKAKRKK